jgi:uncharacterized protein YjdB
MAQEGRDLFFSEYMEGNGNNQALEIFNPEDAAVDLSEYLLVRSNDGGGWEFWRNFPAGDSVPSKTVWTIVNNQFTAPPYNTELADEKDLSPFIAFRGNDAIGLMKTSVSDTVPIDVIGIPDNNPGSGWSVAGINSATANHTLIRKSIIEKGNTDWLSASGINDYDSEWIVKNIDFADSLGNHYFKPIVLINDINLSPSGSATINTDLGTLQIIAQVLPASASNIILSWSSTQPLVAGVDQNGLVQAFNNGTTWIRVFSTDGSGIVDSIKITTLNQSGFLPVNSILVDGTGGQNSIIQNQGTLQMVATISPLNASNKVIEWIVDNPLLADISTDGLLTARKNGQVIVTARSTDKSGIIGTKTIIILEQFTTADNLAALRAAYTADNSVYKVTGKIVLSHWIFSRNIKYFQDESAGIEIEDVPGIITSPYKTGDAISGLKGIMQYNSGMLLFHPVEDPGPATSENNPLTPVLLTVKEFNDNFGKYESQLIKIDNLEFDQAGGIFQEFQNYTLRIGNDITVLRTEFANADYLGFTIPDSANVTGIAIRFNTTPKIAPRKLDDIDYLPLPKTAIHPEILGEVRIYPNPVASELHIEISSEIDHYEIREITGRIVKSGKRLNQKSIINTNDLEKGIYQLTFYFKNKRIDTKFVKQ